ncbi:uncharacterized protein LOC131937833 [Physella acuta]|uniref:uncharacterized protein LOC131937833 n=1 Tax=Physella acuta TaxID=109671 RepID=UPI0027DB5A76|nr:uncharacterized protein LOC131937833 [Physella acuta]
METSVNSSAEVGRSNNPIDTNPLDNGLSDPIWLMVDFVLSVAVNLILSSCGIVANIINVVVFVKQVGGHLTLFWESICVNPYLQKSDIPVAVPDLTYLTAGYLELSINPTTNTTIYVRVSYSNSVFLENIGLVVSAFINVISYIFDILFTIIIILQLQVKSKWRSQATSSGAGKTKLSTKDRKVIKMILLISVLFIVCTFLNCVKFLQGIIDNFIATETEAFKSIRAFFFPWSLVLTCEQILHASNIFIYYNMSANYKLLLGKCVQSFLAFIFRRNKI